MPIDYSKYSREELYTALRSIDRERYPENYAALQAAWDRLGTEASGTGGVPRIASAGSRLLALMVDAFAQGVPFYLAINLATYSFRAAVAAAAVMEILYVAYPIIFHARYGATLGKMALGIRVVREDYGRVGWRAALYRSAVEGVLHIAMAVSTLITAYSMVWPPGWVAGGSESVRALHAARAGWVYLTLAFLANLWMWSEILTCLFNRKRKAIHDFMAGTIVVRADPEGWTGCAVSPPA